MYARAVLAGYLYKVAAEAVEPVPVTDDMMVDGPAERGHVYLGTRAVRLGPLEIGRHSFVVFVPRSRLRFKDVLMDLGNGQKGVVVGAYNVPDALHGSHMLDARVNHLTDYQAAVAHFTGDKQAEGAKTNPQLAELPYDGDVDTALDRALTRVNNYQRNTTTHGPIKYPRFGLGGPNSNTFTQELLESTGILRGQRRYQLPGFVPGWKQNLDPRYFVRSPRFSVSSS